MLRITPPIAFYSTLRGVYCVHAMAYQYNQVGCVTERLIHDAARSGNCEVVSWCIKEEKKWHRLPAVVQWFLPTVGDRLNKRCTPSMYTPLHEAVAWNRMNVIRILLDAGASPNIADGRGRTPIFYAADKDTARVLYRHGAAIDGIEDDDGVSLMSHHVYTRNLEIVEWMLRMGAEWH